MRLSDAIALGRLSIGEVNESSFCGCAIACGVHGAGVEPCQPVTSFWDEYGSFNPEWKDASEAWKKAATDTWPWLLEIKAYPEWFLDVWAPQEWLSNEEPCLGIISEMFFAVQERTIKFDQLIDWVRSVEPAEPAMQEEPATEMEYSAT